MTRVNMNSCTSWVPCRVREYYSQTRLIRTLLIRHFRLIRPGNLKTLKALSLTPMLNYPLNSSPRLVHKISAYFSDELSGSNCILCHNSQIYIPYLAVQGTGYITCVKTKNSFYVTKSQMSSGPFFCLSIFNHCMLTKMS